MMNIKNTVHIVVNNIVNNFIYSIHPFCTYSIIFIHLLTPAYRNSDSIESCIFNSIYHSLCSNRISPCSFKLSRCRIIYPVTCRFKCVTKIPAYCNILYKLNCSLSVIINIRTCKMLCKFVLHHYKINDIYISVIIVICNNIVIIT